MRGDVAHGHDCEIDVNVLLEGNVTLGNRVRIGANCVLRDVKVGDDVQILENCVLEQAEVGDGSKIGPFARCARGRTGRRCAHRQFRRDQEIDHRSLKVNHLSYVGDTEIGQGVNIGAGTITCNYDGANKHRTVISDRAFIGSNSALVAPVTIGVNATIGAGSVIGKDAPDEKYADPRQAGQHELAAADQEEVDKESPRRQRTAENAKRTRL